MAQTAKKTLKQTYGSYRVSYISRQYKLLIDSCFATIVLPSSGFIYELLKYLQNKTEKMARQKMLIHPPYMNLETFRFLFLFYTACAFDIHLYLTPLGQPRKFIETCGT
jgi:hypothetical protein